VAEKRGFVSFHSGTLEAAVADFACMRAAAAAMGDRRREGMAVAYSGMSALYGHEFEDAERSLRVALDIASQGFDDTRLFASVQLMRLYMTTGAPH
jgi:hypothetical protein